MIGGFSPCSEDGTAEMEGKAPWDLLESPVTLERPENRVRKVNQVSLVVVFLLQAFLGLKETRELLGGLETREIRELKAKRDKKERASLVSSTFTGEEPHVLVVLKQFTKVLLQVATIAITVVAVNSFACQTLQNTTSTQTEISMDHTFMAPSTRLVLLIPHSRATFMITMSRAPFVTLSHVHLS